MNTKEKVDVYQMVTNRIMSLLKENICPWRHFANAPLAEPKNLVSGKGYRGINRLLLQGSQSNSEFWLTFRQCSDLGGFVKKGEKGSVIVFWKWLDVKDRETGEVKQIPFLRHYYVWNAEQCSDIDYAKLPEQTERNSNPIHEAEAIIEGMPNKPRLVIDKTPKAFYSSAEDYVHMTERSACISDAQYYSTTFHELAHSTGHASRLNRFQQEGNTHHFGSKTYAAEELTAEVTASFLMSECDMFQETEENSAAYIANWLTRLENDNRLVVTAASKAEKAVSYILGRVEQVTQPEPQPLPMAA